MSGSNAMTMRHAKWNAIWDWLAASKVKTSAIGGLVVFLSGLAVSLQAGQIADARALAAHRNLLREALDQQHRSTLDTVSDLARDDTPPGVLPQRLQPSAVRLDQLMTIEASDLWFHPGGIAASASGPLLQALASVIEPIAAGEARQVSRFVAADDSLFDVAAVARRPEADEPVDSRPRIVVGLRRIDAYWLGRLALLTDTPALRLVRLDPKADRGGALIRLADGQDFHLTWRAERPGRPILALGIGLSALLAAALVALFHLAARRSARRRQDQRATAQLPMGGYDWLSGLPNRVHFNHVLERELKTVKSRDRKMALFYFDVDRFKDVNDTYGIEVSDAMIQAVTQRIATLMRPGDVMGRFEGDAFLILQLDIEGRQDCELLGQRVMNAMRQTFDIDGSRISASVSMGVAIAPDDATERIAMMQAAHIALFRAKREGRGRLAFYKPMMDTQWRRHKSIGNELRDAIDNDGLVLRYQPIVSATTGKTVCAEALVRWHHPTEGMIAPDRFIGLAEDRGLILPLGEWVLRQACIDAMDWPGIRVAVNVSPIQFRHPDFVKTVCLILEETGLDPSRLELELTEGVLVKNEEEAFVAISALRAHGVRMALDDFGTGYSSLIYLRRFAFDKIKIDRAFIDTLEPTGESAILVDSVVRLGRALGLTVTAEGIETTQQRDFLATLDCDELQGFLFSRPISNHELTEFLSRDPGDADPPGATEGDAGLCHSPSALAVA